jgi:hypothetical protein
MWTPQFTTHIIIFGDISDHVRFVWKKSRNRRVDFNRANNNEQRSSDKFLKFPAIFLVSKFVDMRYETKIQRILLHHTSYIIELRLLEYCCSRPDPYNIEFPQLQAHFNIGGIERLPPGLDEFNVFVGH